MDESSRHPRFGGQIAHLHLLASANFPQIFQHGLLLWQMANGKQLIANA
jgi:hypothetical protein